MNLNDVIKNHDFGTVHIQRFGDSSAIRVHVMSSTSCEVTKLDEHGVAMIDPFELVHNDGEIPAAIDRCWIRLQQYLHYGRTGHRNAFGLFFHDPLPENLVQTVEVFKGE
jgi:hypothetical protein